MAIVRKTSQSTNVGQYGKCGIETIGVNDPAKWAEIAQDAAHESSECAKVSCECASKAEDALDKIEAINVDSVAQDAEDARNAAKESKEWAVGLNPDPSHDIASDTNNSMYWSDQAKASETNVVNKYNEVSTMHNDVSTWKDEVEVDKKYVHDFTVGLNPPPSLDTPTDTNNAYYYYQQVLNLAGGAIAFNGIFTPSASKEYPDKTGTSSLWIIQTSDPNGYTFTTGLMAGVKALTGDWMLYYKAKDVYELLKVSPIRDSDVPPASESAPGIAKIATSAEATTGTDDSTIMTPKKTVETCIKRSGDTMNGSLAVNSTGDAISIHYPDVGHGYFKGYRGANSDFYMGRASDAAPGVTWSNYNGGGAAIHIQDSGEIQYNSTGSGEHVFNSTITGTHFITHRTTYPSVRVSGNTGSYGMMELDSVGKNLNLISRNDDGSNRNVWYFKDDGYVKSNKGFETDQYTEGNAYLDQASTGAPFYTGTLTSKASDSAYFPAIKWKSKPSTGKWLTSSIGHILSSGGIDATILTHCDESGADLSVWEFKRPTGDFVSPGNVVAYSDERVKKDIKPIENALDKVKAINGVSYTRTDTGAKQIGVIAQEVEKVLPEIVTTSNNEALGIEDFRGVAYGNITALLIEAIKDLSNQVESLTERLRAFEED